MRNDISESLCNLTIDVALVVKDAEKTIDNNSKYLTHFPEKFLERMWKAQGLCYNLFTNYHHNHIIDDDNINDHMIIVMNKLVEYKKLYVKGSYGYRVMNSLLSIVVETFNDINS